MRDRRIRLGIRIGSGKRSGMGSGSMDGHKGMHCCTVVELDGIAAASAAAVQLSAVAAAVAVLLRRVEACSGPILGCRRSGNETARSCQHFFHTKEEQLFRMFLSRKPVTYLLLGALD